jgi:hypothetical protein
MGLLAHAALAGDDDETGRDFPKTLVFDEPGIDDEVSLPTLVVTPMALGTQTDADFELDKRLTERLSLQINTGYTSISRASSGWQNTSATLKYILFGDRAREQLASFSLTREFGGSGATGIGAGTTSSTTGAVNFGQGFGRLSPNAWIRPFAVTGTLGAVVPDGDAHGDVPQALLSASLQYSLAVLAASRMPDFARQLIPIVEMTYAGPLHGPVHGHGVAAPGLIYAGRGFQLAAEALVPLTRRSGTHVGAIAQLNLSLWLLAVPALSRPIF